MVTNAMQLAMIWMLTATVPAGTAPKLQLHLPRSVRVQGQELQLGSLGVLHGEQALAARASSIAMGRTPGPGEQIVIDRRTIVSRLATAGVDASAVRITGADKVIVMRNETIVQADQLAQAAQAFVDGMKDTPPGTSWRLARGPQDIVVPTTAPVRLEAISAPSPEDSRLVQVVVSSGQSELARAEVLFKQVYEVRQTFAMRDIAAGEILTSDNVEVRTIPSESPSGDWVSPFGQTAARAVAAGSTIPPAILRPVEAAVVVHRNNAVQMRIVGAGFSVTCLGQAMEDGRPGELIRVRNTDSKRIVTARVAADGTVCPVYDKGRP